MTSSYTNSKALFVVCRNCGHPHAHRKYLPDNPGGTCQELIYRPGYDPYDGRDACGCDQWEPMLEPFRHATPRVSETEGRESPWLIALAWALLLALLWYGVKG